MAVAAAVGLGAAACGGSAGDLIAFEISGGRPMKQSRLVVTGDGRARCGGDGPLRALSSERLIEARAVERELEGLAEEARAFGGGGADQPGYVARTKAGTVRWFEAAPGNPAVLTRAGRLALQLERELCGEG